MPKEHENVTKLVDHIERLLQKNYKPAEIKWSLITQKHSKIEIDKAFAIVNARSAKAKKDEEDKQLAMASASVIEEEQPAHKPSFFKRVLGKLKNN
jgi:hypothetical protein